MSESGSNVSRTGTLNKWTMLAMNIGNMVGAGVVSLVGVAIGYTGYSVWFAYGIALLMGFIYNIPVLFVSSAVRLDGGPYTLVNTILGKKVGTFYIVCFLLYLPGLALYGVALNTYVQSLFSGVPTWLTPVLVLLVFYLVQLRGIKTMAGAQNVMTICLIIGLMTLAVFGFSKVDWYSISFSNPDFMSNGFSGVMKASFLLMFSTYAHYYIAFLSRHCQHPKKDIPFSMVGCAIAIAVLYISVSIVAAGVLPLDVVAGQPLTYVAREVLPTPVFVIFIVLGPVMALLTTTNSTYTCYAEPIFTAAVNNYFPSKFAKTNKYGCPYIIYTVVMVVAMLPVILGWDVSTITNVVLIVDLGLGVMMMISLWQVPKRYPEAWAKREFLRKAPNWLFYFFCILAFVVQALIIWNSLSSVKTYIVISTIVAVIIAIAYTVYRLKTAEVIPPAISVDD